MTGNTGKKVSKFHSLTMSNIRRAVLIIYLLILFVVMMFLIYKIWPVKSVGPDAGQAAYVPVTMAQRNFDIGLESRLLLLVILAGALGGCVHVATSFVTYSGNRAMRASWFWWYMFRPIIGMAVALLLYFVVRGGLLLVGSQSEDLSPYGITGIAGLAGMFSKQAADKLREVFDNLFKTSQGEGDDERKDKLGETMSVTEAMVPMSKIVGITIGKDMTPADVTIDEIRGKFSKMVTRIPVFEKDESILCIIHQSLLYKFISDRCCALAEAQVKQPLELDKLYLGELLEEEPLRALAVDSLAFVPVNATLADAKARMDEMKHCQDVLVTEKGHTDEPVVGWLMNVDIDKSLKA